jgi:hypothetical protein
LSDRYWDVVEARSAENKEVFVKYAVTQWKYQNISDTSLAHFLGIVKSEFKDAVNLFCGLRRPLWYDGDAYADQGILIYSWLPADDYEYLEGGLYRRDPAIGKAFVVLVRKQPVDAEGISGTLDHWCWLESDPKQTNRPRDWQTRYASEKWRP